MRALFCFALLGLSGCAWSLVDDGQLREQPFADIVTRTAAARRDRHPGPVDARVVPVDEVSELLRGNLLHERTAEQIALYQTRLEVVGIWPPDRDLIEETLAVAREEVAGFYVPETGILYVVDGFAMPLSMRFLSALVRRDLVREVVLAHEIVHLLQHRDTPAVFDVMNWMEQDDAGSAVQTAFEGDATHYGYRAVLGPNGELPPPEDLRRELEAQLAQKREGAWAEAPALLRLTLMLPYARGYPLSVAEGTQLLEDPPATTEQVLHADRRRAEFEVADLMPLVASLPRGCESLGQNTLGEVGIWVLLQDLGAADASEAASDGWDGDRYLAARCGGRLAFAWWTQWDSEADAAEFAIAYQRIAPAVATRAGLGGPPSTHREGSRVLVASEPLESLVPLLGPRARRARITTFGELRDHFHLAPSR